ncbi:MAG: excinuclease ABC subunit UvrC [Zetaproteobacteria bacterium]|nr:MAG: excinuclease ABC subunit UvrC [Zetaproteobacteria bacterium]
MWITPPIDLSTLPTEPGVYRMLDGKRKVLYVGKARNLRRRVSSYFQSPPDSPRIQAMVQQVRAIETTITTSEAEALILEHNLIKQIKPRYNVLLKDAKSYPYILLTEEHYPRLRMYRGKRELAGEYFGPFPHTAAVHETLHLMQKLFRIRDCEDATFRNRTRPCMQYQIGRCSAPCCGKVGMRDYQRQVEQARAFLRGRDQQYLRQWQKEMEQAASTLDFERAAQLRDRIRMVRGILARQHHAGLPDDVDGIVIVRRGDRVGACIGTRRAGRDLGTRLLRVAQARDADDEEVLQMLFAERYQHEPPPSTILVESGDAMLHRLLRLLHPRARIQVHAPQRGKKLDWLRHIRRNGEQQLRGDSRDTQQADFKALASLLGLPAVPTLIAAVDNAHLSGSHMVSAIVYADVSGPNKAYYRRFKLNARGDDYAGMREVIRRFLVHVQKRKLPMPDLLLIDGGKAQLEAAMGVAREMHMPELRMVGVAKGKQRKVGNETLWRAWDAQPLRPGGHDPAMMLIARVRDEAHRFAGEYLRKRKKKQMLKSPLDAIEGIGPTRRMALLRHFGGIEGVKQASREQLMEVPGISATFAERIFTHLHNR